jgi:hypothetical protein
MSRGILCLAVSVLMGLGTSGCIVTDNSAGCKSPTVGDELRSLKVARDEGALEPGEYDDARHKVLARLDKPPG